MLSRKLKPHQPCTFHVFRAMVGRGAPPPPVLPAGLSSSCQELACLQVDLLVALYRVELALGVQQLRGRAATSTARLQASISRRDQQSAIFGSRSGSQVKKDEARVQRAQQVEAEALCVAGIPLPPGSARSALRCAAIAAHGLGKAWVRKHSSV